MPRNVAPLPLVGATAQVGLTGHQQLSHNATLLFYMSEEGQEGRNAFQDGRAPDFSKYPKRP